MDPNQDWQTRSVLELFRKGLLSGNGYIEIETSVFVHRRNVRWSWNNVGGKAIETRLEPFVLDLGRNGTVERTVLGTCTDAKKTRAKTHPCLVASVTGGYDSNNTERRKRIGMSAYLTPLNC